MVKLVSLMDDISNLETGDGSDDASHVHDEASQARFCCCLQLSEFKVTIFFLQSNAISCYIVSTGRTEPVFILIVSATPNLGKGVMP